MIKKDDSTDFLNGIPSLVSLFLVGIYAIGYTYLKFYYSGFGIDIEYYISLVDIVFFTINQIFATGISWIMLEIGAWILYAIIYVIWIPDILFLIDDRFKKNPKLIERYGMLKKMNMFRCVKIFYLMLLFVIVMGQSMSPPQELSSFSVLPWLIDFLPAIFISIYLLSSKINGEKVKLDSDGKAMAFILVFFVASIFSAFLQGSSKSNHREFLEGGKSVEFLSDKLTYCTEGTQYVFLGETSSYFFLFDKTENKSVVISKTDITKIIFKPRVLK